MDIIITMHGMMVVMVLSIANVRTDMSSFNDYLSILETIHPSLLTPCLDVSMLLRTNKIYGELDQRLALGNYFVQLFNDDNKEDETVTIEFKEEE